MSQCIILAGGLGTRMYPITQKYPKALIPVLNKPFLDYQLNYLYNQNIKNIIICTGYLSELIIDFVGNGNNWGLQVNYTIEEKLMGTAGALRLALDQNKLEDDFIIIYGDSFLPIDFNKVFNYYKSYNCQPLMTIYNNYNKFDKSNVLKLNDNHIIYDKKYTLNSKNEYNYIDYGLSILNKKIISKYIEPNKEQKLEDLFLKLSIENNLIGYEVYERFFEIGSFNGLLDFENYVKNNFT